MVFRSSGLRKRSNVNRDDSWKIKMKSHIQKPLEICNKTSNLSRRVQHSFLLRYHPVGWSRAHGFCWWSRKLDHCLGSASPATELGMKLPPGKTCYLFHSKYKIWQNIGSSFVLFSFFQMDSKLMIKELTSNDGEPYCGGTREGCFDAA